MSDELIDTESNLVKHARTELALLGEKQETVDGYLKIIQAFADMRHSGGSAAVATVVLNQLFQFKNLTPLTNNPEEWEDRSEISGSPFWQNRRNSEAFSKDGGKTYYLLSEEKRLTPRKYHTAQDQVS